ncbi:hypothetical protein ACFO0M_03035 [Micromonospora mangrovi]|uniref:Uncharacterized protein n=2 Tax=Micromonospora TaxID=1873 RepID=A0AAU7M144_9ACTN
MSNYIEITSTPGEIISIANGIRSKGTELTAKLQGIKSAIDEHEGRADTFPSDQFTDPFVKDNYHVAVPAADDDKTVPANEAVKESAVYCGTKLTAIGDFVATAMINYDATDQQGGADIANTPT